jgi:uncharacterized MnhB-related membrane protein
MIEILIAAGILVCALLAIRAQRLLISALWLAGASALVALLIYLLGAPEVAVIELSVGAGLVTVLFVFAINIAGEENLVGKGMIPLPLAWVMVILSLFLLGWLTLPALNIAIPGLDVIPSATATLWEDRFLDIILQIVIIFAGVMGVLGLLSESKNTPKHEEGV